MNLEKLYEDDDFESKLKDIIFNDCDFSEVFKESDLYEYHYFLSHIRHNLFNWYPFKKQGKLLEIGSGYGQLTELFTKKVNHVVCIEDSETKAEIISKRAEDAEVIISDFNNIDIDEKFDYIVLCNIFEYAKSFQNSENPYKDYLIYLRNFLKEDGVILIAISNRLGLKYFAGYREEHTNLYFAGINGYDNINYVETFSKTELEDLIVSSGFSNFKFFYPYPNHEFPFVINTDKFVNKIPFERRSDYFDNRYDLFREDALNQLFARDGIAANFSNSFLVEIRNSKVKLPSDNIDFVKINSDRNEEFQTITTINSDGYAYKSSSSPECDNHIINMYEESKFSLGKINYLDCELIDNSIKYELLKEKSLETQILESILQKDKRKFFRLLEDYYDALFYESFESQDYANSQFLEIFRKESNAMFHCHEKSNLDLSFSNIFIIEDEYVAIDYEWTFDFQIPLEYIFYRVLFYYTQSNILFNEFITIEEVFDYFDLDTSNFDLFRIWDRNFMEYVFGFTPLPQRNIFPIENAGKYEEIPNYVDMYFNFEEIDENKLELIKKDMVLNQKKKIAFKNNQIKDLNRQINAKNKHINQLNNQIKFKNEEIDRKNKKINEIENSNSWKITAPLRKFVQILHKGRGE